MKPSSSMTVLIIRKIDGSISQLNNAILLVLVDRALGVVSPHGNWVRGLKMLLLHFIVLQFQISLSSGYGIVLFKARLRWRAVIVRVYRCMAVLVSLMRSSRFSSWCQTEHIGALFQFLWLYRLRGSVVRGFPLLEETCFQLARLTDRNQVVLGLVSLEGPRVSTQVMQVSLVVRVVRRWLAVKMLVLLTVEGWVLRVTIMEVSEIVVVNWTLSWINIKTIACVIIIAWILSFLNS